MTWKLTCLLLASFVAFGADSQWHWIKVGNNVDHAWDVSRGVAKIEISNGQFTARLFWEGSDKDAQIPLKGSISGSAISARETVLGSDYSGSTYTGRLTTKRWAAGTDGLAGVETITLSDGLGMIGITRAIKQ
jgi:hypothetical protein